MQILIRNIGVQAIKESEAPSATAMDSTGLGISSASAYFQTRSGKRFKSFIKFSTIVLCGSLFPMAFVLDRGPSNDRVQVPQLLEQARQAGTPDRLYADAGYDAEWIHQRCRQQWGVESIIKPNGHRADGKRNGKWRAKMSTKHLKKTSYGKRWAVESFFSAFKRTMGATLSARKEPQQLAEAALRILTYALRR